MKGFRKIVLPGLLVMTALLFTGCGGDAADEYVKEQLEQVRSGDDTTAEMLLEQGMEDVNEDYVIPFPEELKESYCEFLKAACQKVQFEILECEKYNNGYKVRVEFTPVDVAETVKESDIQYARELQSNDLTAEVQKLLEQDTKLLEQAKAADKEKITLYLKKGSSGFEIEEAEWKNCIYSLLDGYMEPYREVAEVIDAGRLSESYSGCKLQRRTGAIRETYRDDRGRSFTAV